MDLLPARVTLDVLELCVVHTTVLFRHSQASPGVTATLLPLPAYVCNLQWGVLLRS